MTFCGLAASVNMWPDSWTLICWLNWKKAISLDTFAVAFNLLNNHSCWRRVKILLASIQKKTKQRRKKKRILLKCGESISARDCFPSGWIVGYIGFLPKLPPISSKLRIRTTFCFAIAGIWTTVCRFKVVEIALKLLHIRCD